MAAGATFPPVVVFYDSDKYWLADGFHRGAAAQRVGVSVRAQVRQGDKQSAAMYACGANTKHGVRRTTADKRLAVEYFLNDAELRKLSSRAIAEKCAVGHPFVEKIRQVYLDAHPDDSKNRN